MRFDRLDLRRFGPFTDLTIDLVRGDQGLHVVYGLNEAGKSSALRAVADLLFGIHPQSKDNFRHAYTEMRLGGSLRLLDGRTLDFVRRKGNKNLLWDPRETQALGDDALAPFLNGVDRSEFERVFGLDHLRLREGAKALLQSGDGAVAAIVGSGLGIPELRLVLRSLESDADARWSARARNKPVNELLSRIKAAEKELNALAVTGSRWHELRDGMEAAERLLREARTHKLAIDSQRETLSRVQRVRESVGALRTARERLPNGVAIPALAADFGSRRQAIDAELAALRGEEDAKTGDRTDLCAALAELATDRTLLDVETEITALVRSAAETRKALADLQELERQHARRIAERDDLARALGITPDGPSIAALRANLRRHATDSGLARAVRDARKLGDVAVRRRALADDVAAAERSLGVALTSVRELTRSAVAIEDFIALPLPGTDWIDDVRRRIEGCDETILRLDVRTQELRDAERRTQSKLESTAQGRELPAETALPLARSVRDELWRLARRAWLHQEDVARDAERLDADRPLQEAVGHAIERADRIVDALRAESDRVATIAALTRELEDCRLGQANALAERQDAVARREACLGEWESAWRALDLVPLPPLRAPEILAARADLVDLDRQLREAQRTRAGFEVQVESARAAVSRALAADTALDFDTAMERAESDLERVQAGEKLNAGVAAADELMQRIDSIRRDAAAFGDRVAELVERCASDLRDREPRNAVEELERRLARQRQVHIERATLQQQIQAHQKALRELEGRRSTAIERQRALCQEAGVDDPALLPVVEEFARAGRELRREGDPAALEQLVDQHENTDVVAALAALHEPQREADAAIERLTSTWIESKQDFEAIDGTPRAASMAQEIQELRSELRREVEGYLRSAMASRMLAAGLERYREQNAAPVLGAASRHFSGLTRGRYTAILSDVDDHGVPYLIVRAAGDSRDLRTDELSDGTRDQLHLALVLGSLEHRFAHGEPMPLVLDDVLVHFDDERSLAALEVLADFSTRTQVLLFTHHGRIREQAASLGTARGVFIHHLGG